MFKGNGGDEEAKKPGQGMTFTFVKVVGAWNYVHWLNTVSQCIYQINQIYQISAFSDNVLIIYSRIDIFPPFQNLNVEMEENPYSHINDQHIFREGWNLDICIVTSCLTSGLSFRLVRPSEMGKVGPWPWAGLLSSLYFILPVFLPSSLHSFLPPFFLSFLPPSLPPFLHSFFPFFFPPFLHQERKERRKEERRRDGGKKGSIWPGKQHKG